MITDNDNNNKVLFIFWNTFLDYKVGLPSNKLHAKIGLGIPGE